MRGIIFDLDNTLYPHERFVRSGFAAVAAHAERRWGIPADRAFVAMLRASAASAKGAELQALCAQYALAAEDVVPELVQVFRNHAPHIWLAHGAASALERLRTDGWRTAVLTNGLPHVQSAKIRALGLAALVDHVVYAAEYAPGGKPDRAPFLEALRRLRLSPAQCVCVGDDPICDIGGARVVGIQTIQVAYPERAMAGADAVVQTLAAVPQLAAALIDGVMVHVA